MYFAYAIFHNDQAANAAITGLVEAHVAPREVTLLVREENQIKCLPVTYTTRATRDGVIGCLIGGLLGIVIGATGLVNAFSAGPALAALGLGAIGAAAGALAGAMRGVGYWKLTASYPHEPLAALGVLIGVSVSKRRIDAVQAALLQAGGTHFGVTEEAPETQADRELVATFSG